MGSTLVLFTAGNCASVHDFTACEIITERTLIQEFMRHKNENSRRSLRNETLSP